MNYIQVTFRTDQCEEYAADLLMAELADIGFECFEETSRGMVGYCPTSLFSKEAMVDVIKTLEIEDPSLITYRIDEIEDRNWNAVWEQNGYEPIVVDNRCCIHAANHKLDRNYPYDVTINPVQSFGTGYHQTTRMILRWILDHDLTGYQVLDMGCGTAVLGILASKRGASWVDAIDIDQWAWQNARDNCATNGVDQCQIDLGDASLLTDRTSLYDVVFANINRNILTADMHLYAAAMRPGATLITSGYYTADLDIVRQSAQAERLTYITHTVDEEWTMAVFQKQ